MCVVNPNTRQGRLVERQAAIKQDNNKTTSKYL